MRLQTELDKIRNATIADLAQQTTNVLLLGQYGAGKTTFISTVRKPVFVHSFDPNGTKYLQKIMPEDSLIVDTTFEHSTDDDLMFERWEDSFTRLRTIGMFKVCGTYVIDSLTMWTLALRKFIARKNGRANMVLTQPDWQVFSNIVIDYVKTITSLPCDFILTGHLSRTKDDITGGIIKSISTTPAVRGTIPAMFDEIWVMERVIVGGKPQYKLRTKSDDTIYTRTRLGGDNVFEALEEADMKKLLQKAGADPSDRFATWTEAFESLKPKEEKESQSCVSQDSISEA